MKNIVLLFFLLLCCAGCRTAEAVADSGTDPAVQTGNTLLAAIQQDDYGAFSECYGTGYSAQEFETARKQLSEQFGELTHYQYLISPETPLVGNHVWLVTFRRTDSGGGKVQQQLLFRLVTGDDGGKLRVIGFGFL